jgi:hypothetical protein
MVKDRSGFFSVGGKAKWKAKKLKDLQADLVKMLALTFYEAATRMFRRELAGKVNTIPLPSGRFPVVDSFDTEAVLIYEITLN